MIESRYTYFRSKSLFRAIVQKTFIKFLSILIPKKFLLYKEKIRKIKGQFD